MKKTNIYSYYAFGFNYSLLKSYNLENREKAQTIGLLDEFFLWINHLDVQVTKKVAEGLQAVLKKIKEDPADKVSAEQLKMIRTEIEKIDPSLDAELKLKSAYILTKKRYSLSSLLEAPQELMGKDVHSRMTDQAKRDFGLGCDQIAFSQPTAAAFHLMRALEEEVKALYFGYKKTKRLAKPMWGPMTKELREKRAPKPSEKLLSHLDGMRIHFRNPTQHPESFYTLDEAQDLLNQTITAINMIAAELP